MPQTLTMLPEWVEQEAIILAWPDRQTDWTPWLNEVRDTYAQLIRAITTNETGVILLIRDAEIDNAKKILAGCDNVLMVKGDYNDTWCRDYCFITCDSAGSKYPIEFVFNGWGNKFDASKDNLINRSVLSQLCRHPLTSFDLVAEGGGLEIDEQQQLLSTTLCLLNPERNKQMVISDYAETFKTVLGAKQLISLSYGHLEGDDTDAHIDTLVRFTPDRGLVIQSCYNRPDDSHFEGLSAMVDECRLKMPEHAIFELPLPKIVNQVGERLPASYANYLINNEQILCPVYGEKEDDIALEIIAEAHPQHRIVAINALPLIQQFGSVHCISMQVPKGTLKAEVMFLFSEGIAIYDC